MKTPKPIHHCFECRSDFIYTDMHRSLSGSQMCKKCHKAKRGYEHLAKVKAKQERYEEQVRERNAKKRAVAEKEASDMLSGTRIKDVKAGGKGAWQAISEFKDALELSRLIRDFE